MNILWIVNGIMPEVRIHLGLDNSVSGHWVAALADVVSSADNVDLSIVSLSNNVKKLTILHGEKIHYYLIPQKKGQDKYHSSYESFWRNIFLQVNPDVVHIHGSEYPIGLGFLRACGNKGVILSIQGMVSVIERYYFGGIPKIELIKNITIRDLLKNSLFDEHRGMIKRGKYEEELIKGIHHVIGRTMWDRAHALAINPSIQYHICNEPIRDPFYTDRWSYDNCIPHSIYVSQGYYPLKGLHILLKAVSIVKKLYPDVTVRFGGPNPLKGSSLKDRLRISGYGKYLRSIIKDLGIQNIVHPLGLLKSEGVKRELLKCNVFVCPSSIENSSNSIGEAQLLGVPCIASYVGGNPDMIPNDKCGVLYRFDDAEMLASQISCTFKSSCKFDNSYMREVAKERHDKERIFKTLLDIYGKVAEE